MLFKSILSSSSSESSCYVQIYQHGTWGGVVDKYVSNTPQLKRNDDASSLKLPNGNGCCVELYEHGNYKGESVSYCKSTGYVSDNWNDKASSLKLIRGTYMHFQLKSTNVTRACERF